jgi:hypothetical protein
MAAPNSAYSSKNLNTVKADGSIVYHNIALPFADADTLKKVSPG